MDMEELNMWRLMTDDDDKFVCPYCLSRNISCHSCNIVHEGEHKGKTYFPFYCKDCGGRSFDIRYDISIPSERYERLAKIRRGETVDVKRETVEGYRISCEGPTQDGDLQDNWNF